MNEIRKIQKYNNGKVTLIVNVASNCGYTDQYAELVTLQENFGDDIQASLGILLILIDHFQLTSWSKIARKFDET